MNARFADIPDLILAPLAGRPEGDWHKAPQGKWCPAQIVQHLAISLDLSRRTFEARQFHAPMRRRPRTLGEMARYYLVIHVGLMPRGREAPPATRPEERPDPNTAERLLRVGVERFLALGRILLPARARDLFVKNPALGDLTYPEWVRFHVRHCAHHARQIRARLAS
jgi:hypothetical protein